MKPKKSIRVDTGIDTISSKTQTDRADKVSTLGPTAALYQLSDVKAALDTYAAEGPLLVAAEAQVVKDDAQAVKSRGARDALLTSLSGSYNVAVATVEKHAVKPSDLTDCGFDVLERAHYLMVPPVDLLVKFDKVNELIDVHVKNGLGMHACQVELSPDPIGATTFKRLDGICAEYHLAGYAPGTWWVHARSVRGAEVSAWVGPVSVIVK